MKADRFLIAPLNSGLQNDVRPWLIPDDAFERLRNAYVFRGRVRKRFGSYFLNRLVAPEDAPLYSRLRVNIGSTDGSGNASLSVPGTIYGVGQQFLVGNTLFTSSQTGVPAPLLSTTAATGTYDTTTGALVISGAEANQDIYFYPAQPVMGFATYEQGAINDEITFAFDTQFAYQFVNNGWERVGSATWTGGNADFFWTTNYRGANASDYILFATNYIPADQIKYYDGTVWTTISPVFNAAADTIQTARIIVPFKDRLVLLNVIENTGTYTSRCRYSQNGSPTAVDAFREDIPGKGGYIDAPTREAITSAEFLRDRLIVFFEQSTWELVYTGNEILPFRWQKINTELGAESTFSVVPFDKVAIAVGNVGVHACNGANVERIDQKIPDEVFKIHNENDGVFRVHGVRDYYSEMVYWTFPSAEDGPVYPTRVLVYNYKNGSWAINDDTITTFGYFQQTNSLTWAGAPFPWDETAETWGGGPLDAKFRDVLAGNQQGYTFIIDADTTRNAPALCIADMVGGTATLTVIDHNLSIGEYVAVEYCTGITSLNDGIYQVTGILDANTITLDAFIAGTYTGGGMLTRVSQLDILTKQYNFYVQQGRDVSVSKIDFYVDRTSSGQCAVDYFSSSSLVSLVSEGVVTGTLLGSSVLETSPYAGVPFENTMGRLWHSVYPQAEGQVLQFRLYFNDSQMRDDSIVWSDFQMHAFCVYAYPTSNRFN